MILVDKPYVSEFFIQTARENAFPIVRTPAAVEMGINNEPHMLEEHQAAQHLIDAPDTPIYTTSENALAWIFANLNFTHLPEKINLFKDKIKFRNLINSLYPDFYYKEIRLDELDNLSTDNLLFPFIIKPAAGFFSLGVHKVSNVKDWIRIKSLIAADMERVRMLYPPEVLDTTRWIIEQNINGDEYAIDVYYNADGAPVILNILKHIFASDEDVSDRVYISSNEIITDNLAIFECLLVDIGRLGQLTNFPVHVEVRIDDSGKIVPIEVNPLRFGGWCTTADLTESAYGFNPYVYYFEQKQPNWAEILKDKGGKIFSIIVLDNSTGVDGSEIERFDYPKLLSGLEKPLELRKIDFKIQPVFGFIFAETREEKFSELEALLQSDLREFIEPLSSHHLATGQFAAQTD